MQQGVPVRAMIRADKTSDSRLPVGCRQVPVALTDVDKLTSIIAQSSAVIYCAGTVRGRRPADFSEANVKGVQAILEALGRQADAPPLLLISSLAASRPQLSDYANSKYCGEELLLQTQHLPWTIIRPPAVYGPGDKDMLPLFKMARRGLIMQPGPAGQRLSLIHVDDLATAIASWLTAWQNCLHKTYSIDDGRPGGYDWPAIGRASGSGKHRIIRIPRILLSMIARTNLVLSGVLGYSPMLTPGKVQELIQSEWLCDNSNFSSATNWQPAVDLRRGVQRLFDSDTGFSASP